METYGKQNQIKKLWIELKTSIKGNELSKEIFNSKGLKCYNPKLRKKFYLSAGISLLLVSPLIPLGFLGTPYLIKWGLR